MNNLSNVEIVILELIKENEWVNGYEINKLIKDRGYSDWASIGKTSIYSGIKKLHRKKYIILKEKKGKIGKGSIPQCMKLTKKGELKLFSEIERALLSQKDISLYYIGLASMIFLSKNKLIQILENRKKENLKYINKLNKKYADQGADSLPLQAKALFEHPILLIKSDIKFIDKLINKIKL